VEKWCESSALVVVFLVGCFDPQCAQASFLRQDRGVQGPFSVVVLGAYLVEGPDGHCGPVMETTLVVWRSPGVSGFHGGGHEGVESVGSGEFLSSMFVFGGHAVVGCNRPHSGSRHSFCEV
jgi:hypothetical protein